MTLYYKLIKNSLLLILLFILAVGGFYLYEEFQDEFTPDSISYDFTELVPQKSGYVSTPEVEALLSQPLHYVGKGHQSYVFGSENSPYVLKIVRFNYLKPTRLSLFAEKIPVIGHYLRKKREAKQKRFWRVFRGYALGFEKDPLYSGLAAIHLVKTDHAVGKVVLYDRYNNQHEVDLNSAAFVIQKKSVPLREVFNELLKKNQVDLVKRKIRQLFKMYITEYQAGLFDEDHNLMINVGFAGETPIRMDMGKVRELPEIKDVNMYKQDLYKIVDKRLDPWFKRNYPQQRDTLRQYMDDLLLAN